MEHFKGKVAVIAVPRVASAGVLLCGVRKKG